ncbi:MAG: DMT family transporter [Sterolibacteriaceae bacterium]|nr:DMT family transporter [Sterolibacteriaceae bacterium]MBK9085280.1 DMT family transporter [Sterolibacteriaceae bacterium]
MSTTAAGSLRAHFALLSGAIVWGLIWYPYRLLAAAGIDGVTSSILTYLLALAIGLPAFVWRRAWRGVVPSWWLVAIALAAGGCNIGYVLATLEGEVMRVLLLFYLSPLWTVLLSRLLLDERLGRLGAGVIALSLAGAAVMLWRPEMGFPWPSVRAEWIGLAAGALFALSNVMIRKTPQLSIEVKSLAVFVGVAAIGFGLLAIGGEPQSSGLPLAPRTVGLLLGIGVVLLAINLIVQFGLTHTPANQAIVIFLFELVVAAVSSSLLAGERMGPQEWVGGAMIVAASLFSGRVADTPRGEVTATG